MADVHVGRNAIGQWRLPERSCSCTLRCVFDMCVERSICAMPSVDLLTLALMIGCNGATFQTGSCTQPSQARGRLLLSRSRRPGEGCGQPVLMDLGDDTRARQAGCLAS
uniref:Uncharacterized protein n=1 Tax=Bionectria ochroleuca TaxID=29856 RepID=A0A8H7NLQ8_BIOOC